MKRILKKVSGLILVLAAIAIWGVYSYSGTSDSILTNAGSLSNTKIGWGVKRAQNHEQPDLGKTNTELMKQYEGIYMGNNSKKYVYLTFDEGYEAGYTEKILDTLKQENVNATFFVTAHYINSASEIVQRMVDDGHIVGNHTVNHKSMPDLKEDILKEEVMKLHQTVFEKFGYEMKYLRPPKGEYSERTLALTKNLGYTNVMWSLAYDDWDENKQGRTDYGKEKIISNIHPGAVILLHATSKDNSEILGDVIKEVKNMGYEFKSLDDYES